MDHGWVKYERLAAGAFLSFSFACGGTGDVTSADSQGAASGEVRELVFEEQVELLPGFSFDSGLQPPDAPVQASFALSAMGALNIGAGATVSGSAEEPTLSGLPERGVLSLDGGFTLQGRLLVAITGVPNYDGDIPGLENITIAVAGETPFDPFALEQAVSVRAEIPPTDLPKIPLPGGLPGSLVLKVAEGSFMDVALTGTSACVEANEARYAVRLDRTGTLVIAPSVEIDVPLAGTKTFDIPQVSVDLNVGSSDVTMTAAVEGFGARPPEGDHVEGSCDGMIGTGGDGGMQTSDASETSTDPSTTGATSGGTTTDMGTTTGGETPGGETPGGETTGGETTGELCPEGIEGCACAPNGGCDSGLFCDQGICLAAGCPDGTDRYEPNDAEAHPLFLGVISDNDGDGGIVNALLDGGGDVDWYWFGGNDNAGNFVNPSVDYNSATDVEVCMYVECFEGVDESSASCPGTAVASTSGEGRPGCCAQQDFQMEIGCPGFNDSAHIFIRVRAPGAQACEPYSLDYHY